MMLKNDIEMVEGALDLCEPEDQAAFKNIMKQFRGFEIANAEWLDKTDWVQEEIKTFPVSALGKHRADVMREEIERLRACEGDARKYKLLLGVLHAAVNDTPDEQMPPQVLAMKNTLDGMQNADEPFTPDGLDKLLDKVVSNG